MPNTSLFMFDNVVDNVPRGKQFAYAGYTDGNFPTWHEKWFQALESFFKLPVAVHPDDNEAWCADCEQGDFTLDPRLVAWFDRAEGRLKKLGKKPYLYTSASQVDSLVQFMGSNGIARDRYLIWAAHYTGVPHLCGPTTCRECSNQADGTQYTDKALGHSLDESLVTDAFCQIVVDNRHLDWYDKAQHRVNGDLVSERGRIMAYYEIKAKIAAGKLTEKQAAYDLKGVEDQCLVLFNRLWTIVHENGKLQPNSPQVKRNWMKYRRGWRAQQLWKAAHGKL